MQKIKVILVISCLCTFTLPLNPWSILRIPRVPFCVIAPFISKVWVRLFSRAKYAALLLWIYVCSAGSPHRSYSQNDSTDFESRQFSVKLVLLGENCKPIIILDHYVVLHWGFPETPARRLLCELTDLIKVSRRPHYYISPQIKICRWY